MSIRLANAPVSVGAGLPGVPLPPAEPFLAELADQGWTGVDLGPPGWLGDQACLRDALDRHGLDLAGGWVDLPFPDDAGYQAAVPGLEATLDLMSAARGTDPTFWPRPTLAVTGTPGRERCPGGRAPGLGLDDSEWARLARNLADAVSRCQDRGLQPTFHPHAGTDVETVEEIERLLHCTDVGLTLDTGHLLLGGGDPVDALRRWAGRINHVHLKDVHLGLFRRAVDGGADLAAVWARNLFCRLGDGDLDLPGVVEAVQHGGFRGWLVVEQDVVPRPDDRSGAYERALADQADNLSRLAALGLGAGVRA